MAAVQKEFHNISSFLGVSCGKITQDGSVPVLKGKAKGYTTILKHLTRQSKNTSLFGKNSEDQAAIDQWLEYRVVSLDRCSTEKDVHNRLNELNSYLKDKVYFVGNDLSLADISIFQALYNILSGMTFYEREKVLHLSRWYNHLQHCEELRQNLSVLIFSKTLLYY
ncbi:hypothetical protein LOTGIDRAFT_149685 [Lottia gigantea]|uniref:GST C-terminal domain-containing protein n=1 Tax=Lottia gigantea TaxID=225164 RepID=V4AT65_LOTGI|nr:hypothetical protein LOTGIDRAFT_149685 [Lottia gigantea]ESP00463.1 hypothetical protein LOTGIDRAFT_149685 [Lottia gigantea]